MRVQLRMLLRWIRRTSTRRSATVRYTFPILIVVGALLGAAASTSDTSYVRITTDPREVEAEKTFTINVYAHAAVPTNAIDIRLAYPDDQITIEGIDVGESVITIWTEEPYARNGTVYLRGGVYRRGFLGEHLIARVRAHAKQSGVAHILASDSQFVAGDGKGTIVTVSETGSEETKVYVTRAGELKSTVSIGIVTDIDGDGDVDLSDIHEFLSAWRAKQSVFDFNGDGKMTFRDFGILLAHSFFK